MLGILCQIYNLFDPSQQPYMQQLSFMFVAMPSALAIIHHYYYYLDDTPATSTAKVVVPTDQEQQLQKNLPSHPVLE
jgi:hypothetical protein